MSPWVIDANVWVAAADSEDIHSNVSRRFLLALMRTPERIVMPAIAPIEVACALARRLRSASSGRALARRLEQWECLSLLQIDALSDRALELGTELFLRAADALYAAAARQSDGQLISWDQALVQRAGAVTPEEWLATHTEA